MDDYTVESRARYSGELGVLGLGLVLSSWLTEPLGDDNNDIRGNGSGNSRNGKSRKRFEGDHGDLDIETPRDREGTFDPMIVKKGQSRLTQMDEQILSLQAKGMSTGDITATFKDLYDADVSPSVISKVIDAALNRVTVWQSRELEPLYPIMYLDCIVLQFRENQQVFKSRCISLWTLIFEARMTCSGMGFGKPRSQILAPGTYGSA